MMKIWILTEVEAMDCGDMVQSWSSAFATKDLLLESMEYQIQEKIKFNEDNGYPKISIDWKDDTGAQLSTLDNDRWMFNIQEVNVHSN